MALRLDDVDLVRDRALVEQFQAGDVAGFEDLYRRYYGRLYRFCLKRVGDPLEAEELTQESFVRAFRALTDFAGERRFYPWLSVIAARLCVDNHRRKARTEPSAEIDTGVTDGGQERIVDAVDVDLLNEALARLGPRHREVLRLREEEGWSYQHIAAHFGVSLGTVEALLWRARRALRREFIAVAGPESTGAAAGLPLIGWLVRRAHGLRTRVGEWTQSALPAIANGAVSMAVVVGSSAGVAALVHEGAQAAEGTARTYSAPVVSTVLPAGAADAVVAASPSATATPSTAHPTTSREHAAELRTGAGTRTKIVGREEAQREYDSQPLRIAIGNTGVSADPAEAMREISSFVQQSIRRIAP